MKATDFWTVDQALLWLATADADLVDDAGPNGSTPWTWVTYSAAAASDVERSATFEPYFATQMLLQMLRDGDVTAFSAGEPVPRLWFYNADYQHGAGALAVKLHYIDELATIICRISYTPRVQTREYEERDIESMPLLIEAGPLLAVHGWPPVGPADAASDAAVKAPARKASSRGRYARVLIQRAFGSSPPPPNSMKPVELNRVVVSQALKSDDAVIPDIRTILREIGWSS